MKNILLMLAGVLLFGFAAIYPLPATLKAGLGILSCGLFALGVYGKVHRQGS